MTTKWNRPKEIVFIRHGESWRNKLRGEHLYLPDKAAAQEAEGMYDPDVPLTEKGREQAEISGPCIVADIGYPDYIYHSGYKRAKQTMEGLLVHLHPEDWKKIQIRESIKLRERDPGYTWYMTKAELDHHFPWLSKYRRRVGELFYRPPGGESILDVYDGRLYGLLNAVIRDRPGKVVWFICHGNVIRAARILMERLTIPKAQRIVNKEVPNVAVTRYVYGPSSLKPKRTHLNRVYWKHQSSPPVNRRDPISGKVVFTASKPEQAEEILLKHGFRPAPDQKKRSKVSLTIYPESNSTKKPASI